MKGLLLESVCARTKQPYRAPDSASFFDSRKPVDYVADLFITTKISHAGYFDAIAKNKLFEKCRTGRATCFADNMAFFAIVSAMLLYEQFIKRNGPF